MQDQHLEIWQSSSCKYLPNYWPLGDLSTGWLLGHQLEFLNNIQMPLIESFDYSWRTIEEILMSIMQKLLSQKRLLNEAHWNVSVMNDATFKRRIFCTFIPPPPVQLSTLLCCYVFQHLHTEVTQTFEGFKKFLTVPSNMWPVTSSSGAHHSTGNFHSSNRNIFIWYWIWIWIDWFSLGRSGDWCLKRCSVKTYSSFWPVQRKARVFL